jgi:thymidylate synthase
MKSKYTIKESKLNQIIKEEIEQQLGRHFAGGFRERNRKARQFSEQLNNIISRLQEINDSLYNIKPYADQNGFNDFDEAYNLVGCALSSLNNISIEN